MKGKVIIRLLISALCGVLSFFVDFVLIPQTVALPDIVWIILMFVLPILIAVCLLGRDREIHPAYIWVGLLVQYMLLCIFSKGISQNLGISLSAGLYGLSYVYEAAIWPLSVTIAQFLVLSVLHWKRKHRT